MDWQEQTEKQLQVMRLGNCLVQFLQQRFEVFFRRLLAMEAHLVMKPPFDFLEVRRPLRSRPRLCPPIRALSASYRTLPMVTIWVWNDSFSASRQARFSGVRTMKSIAKGRGTASRIWNA